MEGSVYQRNDGRWVGVADAGKNLNGKRKQKYVYAKTKKEATIKLNNLVYEIQNNIFRDPCNATLKGFIEEWYNLNINSWEETTAALYRVYLDKHIYPLLGDLKLKSILPMHITDFVNKKLKDNSANTVNKYLSFLNGAFDYAVINQLVLTNPLSSIKRPKKTKYTPRIYSEKEFSDLLSHVEGTFDEIPILLAGSCGLRRGEIFGLRWRDVDFENCTITISQTNVRFDKDIIKTPKNETSSRVFKVPDFVFAVLENYRRTLKVIPIDDNVKVCAEYKVQVYSEHFRKLLEKYNLPHIRLHDLRHFNAVIMMKYHIPDKVAAQRLGHSNTQTLREVYQHVLTDMDKAAADVINSVLKINTDE